MTDTLIQWKYDLRDKYRGHQPLGQSEMMTEFCEYHIAVSRGVLRKGLREGYPSEIDFVSIPHRLETDWIRKELVAISRFPRNSPHYQTALTDLERLGIGWRRQGHQRSPLTLQHTSAGYFGQIGKSIILQQLDKWIDKDRFPTIKPTELQPIPTCDPFYPNEFTRHVLLPEASVLLIMQDQAWEGGSREEFEETRDKARKVWAASRGYGRWAWIGLNGEEIERQLLEMGDGDVAGKKKAKPKKACRNGKASTQPAKPAEASGGEGKDFVPDSASGMEEDIKLIPGRGRYRSQLPMPTQTTASAGCASQQSSTSSGVSHQPLESPTLVAPNPKPDTSTSSSSHTGRPRRIRSSGLQKVDSFASVGDDLDEADFAVIDEIEQAARRKR